MKTLFFRKNASGFIILTLAFLALLFATPAMVHSAVTQTAVVVTAASDYSSGAHSVISVDPVGGPRSAQNNLSPTLSDLSGVAYGRYFYRLGRYNMDHITKFDIDAPDTPIWQFSVAGTEDNESANPHDMIFVNENKAYLLQYGLATAWIVNPSVTAETESEFRIGELDLSAYDDGDGTPEMHVGVIVDGKLFIVFQRWDSSGGYGNWVLNEAWVAVFDTETDTEISTGKGNEAMAGIPLPARNPQTIQYLEENNTIYIQCAGSLTDAEYTGGIVTLNPDTYETAMLLDDGDDDNHPYGNISGMSIASSTKGYFVGYLGWGDNVMYTFDPSTGTVNGPANDYLNNKNIAGMESGAYVDKNAMLWVCNATDGEIVILNTTDDSIDETVSTELNPQKVVFVTVDDNQPPDAPVLSSPENNVGDVSLTPELQTEAFSDPDSGDTHASTRWQISTDAEFSSTVLDTTDDSALTSLTVADSVLTENTTYYWRARFYDSQDGVSEWSDVYAFTTIAGAGDDDDDDDDSSSGCFIGTAAFGFGF